MVEETFLAAVLVIICAAIMLVISKRWTLLPFPPLLFISGLVLSFANLHFLDSLQLTPETVLTLYLPVLLFDSAIHFKFREFRIIAIQSLLFATVGLLISSLVIAFGFVKVLDIPFLEAFLFGAIISSTDPIAVLSIFKNIAIPKKLVLLIDAESFLNDASSIIAARVILGFIAASAGVGSNTITLAQSGNILIDFILVIVGGVVVGTIISWIYSEIVNLIEEIPEVEIGLTILLPGLTFLLAEHIGGSGVISVLTLGLVIGNYGRTKISPSILHLLDVTWGQISFLVTSLVFFFIGYQIGIESVSLTLKFIVLGTIFVLLGRLVSVLLLGIFMRYFPSLDFKFSWSSVLVAAGIKGVLPLMLLISLENEIDFAQEFIQLTSIIIMITMLCNTFALQIALKQLELEENPVRKKIEKTVERLLDFHKQKVILERLFNDQEISKHEYDEQSNKISIKMQLLSTAVRNKLDVRSSDAVYAQQLSLVIRVLCLQIEKAAYTQMYKDGMLDSYLVDRLTASLLKQETNLLTQKTQFSDKRIPLEEKIKRIKKGSISFSTLQKLLLYRTESKKIQDLYRYYLARVNGNYFALREISTVLEKEFQLDHIQEIIEIKEEYKKLLKENTERLERLKIDFKDSVESYEHLFCNTILRKCKKINLEGNHLDEDLMELIHEK